MAWLLRDSIEEREAYITVFISVSHVEMCINHLKKIQTILSRESGNINDLVFRVSLEFRSETFCNKPGIKANSLCHMSGTVLHG